MESMEYGIYDEKYGIDHRPTKNFPACITNSWRKVVLPWESCLAAGSVLVGGYHTTLRKWGCPANPPNSGRIFNRVPSLEMSRRNCQGTENDLALSHLRPRSKSPHGL